MEPADTDELIMDSGKGGIHPGVFYPALAILLAACFAAIVFPSATESAPTNILRRLLPVDGHEPLR